MNARAVSAAAGVVHAAMQTHSTAAGIAAAVDAAGLLMSPETAAELARLRAERDGTVALSPAGTAYLAAIRARHAAIEGGGWHLAPEPHVEPGTVRTMVGGYQRIIGVFDFRGAPATADANREFVLYAPSDVGFLLGQMNRLRARVAEVEKQLVAQETALRSRIAQDVNRARRPVFATTEAPELVVKTTRAIDVRLIEMGDEAPYWEPEAAPYRSSPLPPRDAICAGDDCGHSGAEHHHGDTRCWARLPRLRDADGTWSAVRLCTCTAFVAGGVL